LNHSIIESSDIVKTCIFNNSKTCNNCGECDVCEYNKEKICDNCSKCLQLEGYDVKAIKIDEVFEKSSKEGDFEVDIAEFSDFDNMPNENDFEEEITDDILGELSTEEYIDALDDDNNWEYIDDIEEIKELLEENDLSQLGIEKYPGLIVINDKK
jgi:hypothetical protein